jgi:hypothetical protein
MCVKRLSGPTVRPKRSRRAAAVVETAFVLPLAMLLIMGIFEYGRFMMARHPSPAGRYTSAGFANHPSVTNAKDTDQFSSNASIRSQSVGGNGRRGAQRLVILETDGMANVNTNPAQPFYNGGTGHSYYRIRPGDTFAATGYNEMNLLNVVRKICALETDNVDGSGFSTSRRAVQVHAVAFGAIFEPTTPAANQTDAVELMQSTSTIGGSVFPSSSTDADNGYKWCIGTLDERKTKLRRAFSKIMEDGASVSLVD